MDSLLDEVQRVTPMKTKESVPAKFNSETNTEINQEYQTDTEGTQETQIIANTTSWNVKMKELIPSLTLMDIQDMEEKGSLSMEDIGWHDKDSLAPRTMYTATTKRNLMFGYESHSEIWSL